MSPVASPAAVVLAGVSHRYAGDRQGSLDKIDLAIERSAIVALIGPSGAGKSTLLTLLDGRLRGWRGAAVALEHALDARHAPEREQRADVGFIFQEFALVERATVRQNVLNGRLGRTRPLRSLFGRFSEADHVAAQTAMRDAGIIELADKRADRLSGGQRQRVAIARCLAQEPRLILADEPVSNLDPARAESVLRLLGATAKRRGATLIFSSHQPDLATRFAKRIIALKDGRVSFDGAPSELTPERLREIYADEHPAEVALRLVG